MDSVKNHTDLKKEKFANEWGNKIKNSVTANLYGIELLQIMDRLGHTEDEITIQVYLHITKDRKKKPLKSLRN